MRLPLLVLGAQLADLAAYLLVGGPDDSLLQAAGVDVPLAKVAGIVAVFAIVAVLHRRTPGWARRGSWLAAAAGLVGAASGIRAVLA